MTVLSPVLQASIRSLDPLRQTELPPWLKHVQGYHLQPHFKADGSSCLLPPLANKTKRSFQGVCTPQSQPASDITHYADPAKPLIISMPLYPRQGSQALLFYCVITSLLLCP